MKIRSIHPKYVSDENLAAEHDFLHELLDSLLGEGPIGTEHPDYFRFSGKAGLLYVRHRMLVEEMNVRGMSHTTLIDRRPIAPDEMRFWEVSDEDVIRDRDEAVAAGEAGREALLGDEETDKASGINELCSAIAVQVDGDILKGLWRIYRYAVMEKSYSRYRAGSDPLQGRMTGQTWILFDLMLEEAFAVDPDDNGPRIAYETLWESLGERAALEEKAEFDRLLAALEPGRVSLDMRRHLASVAARQERMDLMDTVLLKHYVD